MDNSTAIATSRLIAQQRAMEVTANNLANANTPGFRTERVQFSDWLSRQPAASARIGEPKLAYTQDRATWRERQAGTVTHTGNPLDLALSGDAFFTVQTATGPRLTRAGRFTAQPDGTIADEAGNALLDKTGQKLKLSPSDTVITVASDGTLSSENGQIGRIGLVAPKDPVALTAEGSRLFQATGATAPATAASVVQGAVEDSNVAPVLQLNQMLTLAREFQFVTQFVQAEADRHQSAIDKIVPAQG